jgi:glycosyltransferase involved in cell wall biosynthesis
MALAVVSQAVQDIVGSEFGRQGVLIPNSVDCKRFFPGPVTTAQPTAVLTAERSQGKQQQAAALRSVLLVGNPALPLKGFDVAITVLAAINQIVPLAITWVCQSQPTASIVPALVGSGLRLNLYINPSQELLPELYRGHDVFLFTSRYEAWGMPVMEAMASGLAVVSTRCLGVNTFARHGVNALLADPLDMIGIVRNLLAVMTDDKLRLTLQIHARQTALQFTPNLIADRLEGVLYSLTACAKELLQLRQPAIADLQLTCACASDACISKEAKPKQQPIGQLQQEQQQQQQQSLPQPPGQHQLGQQHLTQHVQPV